MQSIARVAEPVSTGVHARAMGLKHPTHLVWLRATAAPPACYHLFRVERRLNQLDIDR